METVLDHLARAGATQERAGRWTVTEEAATASGLAEGLRPFLQRRLAGEVLLAEGGERGVRGELSPGAGVAPRAGARSLELRAATSLSRLGSQASWPPATDRTPANARWPRIERMRVEMERLPVFRSGARRCRLYRRNRRP